MRSITGHESFLRTCIGKVESKGTFWEVFFFTPSLPLFLGCYGAMVAKTLQYDEALKRGRRKTKSTAMIEALKGREDHSRSSLEGLTYPISILGFLLTLMNL